MTFSFLYLYLCSLFLSITAANDWNKPCFSGVCEYDIPSTNGRSSGTLTIWGGSNSIGDITPAAGWAILSCSPDSLKQTIRIACMDEGSPGCKHLFGNTTNLNDAVGKVVRLPETCGMNAFGIITRAIHDEDQSIPVSMLPSLTRRDGTLPTVHGLHISTNPSAVAGGQQVHFAIRSTSISDAAVDSPNHMPQNVKPRGPLSSIKHTIKNLVNEVNSANDFVSHDSIIMPPVNVNKKFSIFNETITCVTPSSGASISVETELHAVMGFCIFATGTIIPPKVDFISLTGNMTGNLNAIMELSTNVHGTLDLAEIKLFQVGLPGLNFPGILSIGPSFEIVSKATLDLDGELHTRFGINYNINKTSFTFPNGNGLGGSIDPQDTLLKVNMTPSMYGTGAVALHLIPSLNFGISAFGDNVNTKVFMNLDSSVYATIGVKAAGNETAPPLLKRKSDLTNDPRADSQKASVDRCFQAGARLSVNVGAESDFFNLFGVTTQTPLYNKSHQLFERCFSSGLRERSWPPPIIHRRLDENPKKQAFNLQCSPLSTQTPIPIVDKIINASSIREN